jgi:GT2 family glycosyltransferase
MSASYALDGYLGQALIGHSRTITQSIVKGATVERFETAADRFKGSVIVCLYGKAEFQFVQNALFAAGAGAEDYEYIYVSNSPELIEILCKTAQISRRVYGLNVSVVMLPGNAGFGAANNIAAQHARSRRVLIVNPDVFPIDRGWAARHNAAVEQLPAEQTKLFAPRLLYADGSLMHAGMYLDIDWGVSVADFDIRRRSMLRVEHYGKGAPKDAGAFRGSRAVAAVSGAFMSLDRSWFERIGGFSEDYIFAYYEDADLCLRSWNRGAPSWVHELDFWHLEGKGSSTPLPHHKGAALVNRWLFTREWHDRVVPELLGRVTPSISSPLRAMGS